MGFNDCFFVRPGVRKSEEDRVADAATTRVINALRRTQIEYQRPPTSHEIQLYGRGLSVSLEKLEGMLEVGVDNGNIVCGPGNVPGNPSEITYWLPGDREGTLYNKTEGTFNVTNYRARKEFGAQARGTRLKVGTLDSNSHGRPIGL